MLFLWLVLQLQDIPRDFVIESLVCSVTKCLMVFNVHGVEENYLSVKVHMGDLLAAQTTQTVDTNEIAELSIAVFWHARDVLFGGGKK